MDAKRATLIVASAAMFMAVMDAQIVNVALPSITRYFHSANSSSQWIITSYLLSLAVCMPTSGWIGDRFGTKRVFLVAIVTFTGASALCGASLSLAMLVIMRVIQGAGGGMLTPVAFTMLYRAYPQTERIAVARMMTLLMILAPASAPLIGGVLVTAFSWRWIFLVNVPVGIAILPFTIAHIREHEGERVGSFDPAGLLFGGPGLALFLYAINEGPIVGWSSPRVWVAAALAVILMGLFLRAELARPDPMLDLRLLGESRLFSCGVLIQVLYPLAFYGSLVFTSVYVQETRGESALVSGLTTFPEAIGIGVCSPLVSVMYRRTGPRRLIAFGFAVTIVACALLAQVGETTSLWLVRAVIFLLGLGVANIMLPTQAATFAQISETDTGHASAIFNTAQRTGQAVGVAILTSVLAIAAGTSIHPHASAFRPVYLTAAGFALLGLIVACTIRDSDAAGTMVRVEQDAEVPAG